MRLRQLLAVAALLCAAPAGFNVSVPAAQAQGRSASLPVIENIAVSGNQRIEPATVVSYLTVRPGDRFDPAVLDDSLKRLFATGLFADVSFERDGNTLIVRVVENPIINRIIFEGNNKLDDEELSEEVQLRPRIVFTRAKVRADVQRILDLYRRSGRFAAVVEPKVVQLEQNRVDLIFEISEGPKSKIRRINFIGNEAFSDGDLRDEMATVEARWWKIFTSNDTYDPDRQAFDREQLRRFYFNEGYADFRVLSAVAELTPNREDFIVTFVVEEGEVYKFGEVKIESEIKDIDPEGFRGFLSMRKGETYSLEKITNSVDTLTNAAGVLGYAFVDIRPIPRRNRETRTLDITFLVREAPRVYVERIEIQGNLRTRDEVIRREIRLVEGDAFNLSRVERSKQRIQRLGFFREVEVEELPGSREDRVVLDVNVQEDATGSLQLGAAFSSLENFIFEFSIRERNWLGRGQDLRLGLSFSSLRQQIDLGFTEPYFLGRNISAGFDLFRTEFDRRAQSSFEQTSTGGSLRLGLPLAERVVLALRYTIRNDEVAFDSRRASRFILASIGEFLTSQIGYSLIFDTLNHPIRPTRGQRLTFSQDIAGLGGDRFFIRNRLDYDKFIPIWRKFYLRLGTEAGFVQGLGQDVVINNRFFLGGPRVRGFDTAGLGPRAVTLDDDGAVVNEGDFVGGEAYYIGTMELFVPLGEAAEELGIQTSLFVDAASLFRLTGQQTVFGNEIILGNTAEPRFAVGLGVAWESPFGPFRIDLSRTLNDQPFDDTETLQFNVGTSF